MIICANCNASYSVRISPLNCPCGHITHFESEADWPERQRRTEVDPNGTYVPTIPVPVNRVIVPRDCTVISGCNKNYLRGAYLMTWSLLRVTAVNVVIYIRNIPENDPHIEQMRGWGVQFRPMPTDVPLKTLFSETWNKPACIADALKYHERVLWLDSDVSVGRSIHEAFDIIAKQTFAADHGNYGHFNRNDPIVWEIFAPPRRMWEGSSTPNAGVIGFRAGRDDELIQTWRERCIRAANMPELATHQRDRDTPLKYNDQGILQDLLVDDTQDGFVWSNFESPGSGDVAHTMAWTLRPERIITHWGGPDKPWLSWPAVLRWPHPFRATKSPSNHEAAVALAAHRISICRSCDCGSYEAGDRCRLLGRACQLPGVLKRGWKCPEGFHG